MTQSRISRCPPLTERLEQATFDLDTDILTHVLLITKELSLSQNAADGVNTCMQATGGFNEAC